MSRVALYVTSLSVAAALAALWLYFSFPSVPFSHVKAAALFAALGIFAQFLSYQLPRGAVGSIAFLPTLAAATLVPSWIAVAAAAVSMLCAQLIARRSPLKILFNVAQYSLATAVAILAYLAAGGEALLSSESYLVLPFLCLFVVFVGINTIAVSAVIALNERRRIWQVWRENTVSSIAYDLLSLPIVYLFAWVYLHYGATGAVILAVPLLGIRQLYKTNWQLEAINHELLQLMVAAIEARDPYTSGHSRRVAHYSRIIARACGLNRREVDRVGVAALLHDVGKIYEIYAPILRKPDRLTADEQAIMQTHPVKSAELVQNVSQLKDTVLLIRHHHENWDGSGYPDGLRATDIPLGARIIMIADTVDAMTTDRPYRKALGPEEVRAELRRFSGKQFDPQLCDILLNSTLFLQIFAPPERGFTPRYSPVLTSPLERKTAGGN